MFIQCYLSNYFEVKVLYLYSVYIAVEFVQIEQINQVSYVLNQIIK